MVTDRDVQAFVTLNAEEWAEALTEAGGYVSLALAQQPTRPASGAEEWVKGACTGEWREAAGGGSRERGRGGRHSGRKEAKPGRGAEGGSDGGPATPPTVPAATRSSRPGADVAASGGPQVDVVVPYSDVGRVPRKLCQPPFCKHTTKTGGRHSLLSVNTQPTEGDVIASFL